MFKLLAEKKWRSKDQLKKYNGQKSHSLLGDVWGTKKKIFIDQLTCSSHLILKILSAKYNYTYLTHAEIEAQRG